MLYALSFIYSFSLFAYFVSSSKDWKTKLAKLKEANCETNEKESGSKI
jgi:hypothetical protein